MNLVDIILPKDYRIKGFLLMKKHEDNNPKIPKSLEKTDWQTYFS